MGTRNDLLKQLVALYGGTLKEGTDNALLRELVRLQTGQSPMGANNDLIATMTRSVSGAVLSGTDNAQFRAWARFLASQAQEGGDAELLRVILNNTSLIHPDTLAWESAIVANGGTVSAGTLALADEHVFQVIGENATLKSKIRQLLLIAGNDLNAARTAAYGTHATIVNFVSGDYAESTGLTGRSGAVIDSVLTTTGLSTANYGLLMLGTGMLSATVNRILCGSIAPTASINNFSGLYQAAFNGLTLQKSTTINLNGIFSTQMTAANSWSMYDSANTDGALAVAANSNANRTVVSLPNKPFYMGRNNSGSADWTAPNTARLFACATTDGLTQSETQILSTCLVGFNNALSTNRRFTL